MLRTRVKSDGWDTNSLEEAYRRHASDVFAAAYRVTGNTMDAEDAVHAVFMGLARRAPTSAPRAEPQLGAYLRRAGVNAALDARRRSRKIIGSMDSARTGRFNNAGGAEGTTSVRTALRAADGRVLEAALPSNGWPPNAVTAEADDYATWLREALRDAISQLTGRPAEMFALRYLEGFTNREIADLLRTSESVVGVTLFRAREQLKSVLTGAVAERQGADREIQHA